MITKNKKWDSFSEEFLKSLMNSMEQSIVNDAEAYADFMNKDNIEAMDIEIGFYKAVTLINESNKAVILKKFGYDNGMKLINSLETRAMSDVMNVVIEDISKEYNGELPPDIQNLINKMKGLM